MLKKGDIVYQRWYQRGGTYDGAVFEIKDAHVASLCDGVPPQNWVHVKPLNRLARRFMKETQINWLVPGINSIFFFLANGLVRARYKTGK